LLNDRKQIPSFHPSGTRQVLDVDKSLLVVLRQFRDEGVCVIINVCNDTINLPEYRGKLDLITHTLFDGKVAPYGVYFLK
jgi:hypothetical protein